MPLNFFMDSQTAWDGVANMSLKTERRLLVDIFQLRESYRSGEMSYIARIDISVNP